MKLLSYNKIKFKIDKMNNLFNKIVTKELCQILSHFHLASVCVEIEDRASRPSLLVMSNFMTILNNFSVRPLTSIILVIYFLKSYMYIKNLGSNGIKM